MTTQQLIAKYITEGGFISSSDLDWLAKQANSDTSKVVLASMNSVIAEFSRDVARKTTAALTNDGTDMELTGWFEDSMLLEVEYPTGQRPRELLQLREVELDADAGTIYFHTVPSGSNVNVVYTIMHTLPEEEGEEEAYQVSIPASRITPFFYLASRHLADRMAAAHAASVNPGYGESIDYKTISSSWRNNAREYDKRYREIIGLSEQRRTRPAEVRATYDQPDHRSFSVDPRYEY